MSKQEFVIGADISTEDHDTVVIESNNGDVAINCPAFADWMGFQTLAELPTQEEGDALARKIAANPVAELSALGYDCAEWFRATSAV